MFVEYLFDTGSGLRILGDHIEVASTTSTWEFIAQTEVIHQTGKRCHSLRIRTTIELLVLLPRLTHELPHPFEIVTLDSLVHLHRVLLHLAQQPEFATMVQEHPAHDLCQDLFRRTGDTRVIKKVTGTIFGLQPQVVG